MIETFPKLCEHLYNSIVGFHQSEQPRIKARGHCGSSKDQPRHFDPIRLHWLEAVLKRKDIQL